MEKLILPKAPLLAPLIVRSLVKKNKEEKMWLGTEVIRTHRTTNISRTRIEGTIRTEKFGKEKIPDAYAEKMIHAVKFYPNIFFYVEDSQFGFYPILSLIFGMPFVPSFYIMKWTPGRMSEEAGKKIEKMLYSTVNQVKYKTFGFSEIHPLSYYEY